jgi:hypothetical protein
VAAVGLGLGDLFDRPQEHLCSPVKTPLRPTIDAVEVLIALDLELLTGAVVLLREGADRPLSTTERDLLVLAAQRVSRAILAVTSLRESPAMGRLRRGEGRDA